MIKNIDVPGIQCSSSKYQKTKLIEVEQVLIACRAISQWRVEESDWG